MHILQDIDEEFRKIHISSEKKTINFITVLLKMYRKVNPEKHDKLNKDYCFFD